MEVEVPTKHLIAALTRQHHLHAQGLDLAGHEEHGGGRADGGGVKRLNMVNHVANGVNALLRACKRTMSAFAQAQTKQTLCI